MSDERTKTRYVPPTPADASQQTREAEERKEQAMKSPEFREALRRDDEREAQAKFNPDRGIFGQTGAGPDVKKTAPEISQDREAARARREDGYADGQA